MCIYIYIHIRIYDLFMIPKTSSGIKTVYYSRPKKPTAKAGTFEACRAAPGSLARLRRGAAAKIRGPKSHTSSLWTMVYGYTVCIVYSIQYVVYVVYSTWYLVLGR